MRGGEGKTSAKCWFLLTIVLQCLVCSLVMEGSLGSYVTANTGLFFFLLIGTLFRAASLGILFALLGMMTKTVTKKTITERTKKKLCWCYYLHAIGHCDEEIFLKIKQGCIVVTTYITIAFELIMNLKNLLDVGCSIYAVIT